MIYADIKNKILYWSLRILIILFGVFLVIFGGVDDSPGAQLIGLVLIITGIVFIFKSKKKHDFREPIKK
ncbi:MAG: LPXTG cell wall anchor domain-containing protein [Candidatus Paceibacterota bacterium]|jgi:LPXTG-motif cell wall-anchored protein